MRRLRPLLLAALLVSFAASQLSATLLVEYSTEDLIRHADLIVTGRCTGLETTRIDGQLVTLATISVDEVLRATGPRAEPKATITVATPGGIDRRYAFPVAVDYAGAPRFFLAEEVFLFLQLSDPAAGLYTVVGFSQGKFTIRRDRETGKVLDRDLSALQLVRQGQVRQGTPSASPLEKLEDAIRNYQTREKSKNHEKSSDATVADPSPPDSRR